MTQSSSSSPCLSVDPIDEDDTKVESNSYNSPTHVLFFFVVDNSLENKYLYISIYYMKAIKMYRLTKTLFNRILPLSLLVPGNLFSFYSTSESDWT